MVVDAHIGGVTAQSGDVYHLGFTNVKVNKYLLPPNDFLVPK